MRLIWVKVQFPFGGARGIINIPSPEIVGFKLGDIYPEVFTYEKGERKGQQGVSIKARLLKVKFAKVEGQAVALPESPKADEATAAEAVEA